jgi:hypothetical protein
MSIAFEAKQHALAAYPDDREAATQLFLDYCGIDEDEFQYEFSRSSEQYIFGENKEQKK